MTLKAIYEGITLVHVQSVREALEVTKQASASNKACLIWVAGQAPVWGFTDQVK